MKRILIAAVALAALTACGPNDKVVNQPGIKLRYDHFADMDTGRDGCDVTLVFKDTAGVAHAWNMDCNDALRKLEWLQKGGCYELPLNVDSPEIPCG